METESVFRRRKSKLARREKAKGFTIALLVVIYTMIFFLPPILMLFYYSFTDYGLPRVPSFLGWENYRTIFQQTEYLVSFGITFLLATIVNFLGIFLGFLLAVGLNSLKFGKGFARVIWYIPGLLSMAVVAHFLDTMIAEDGALNRIFMSMGMQPVDWYNSTVGMWVILIGMIVSRGLGNTAILFIAGLNAISPDVYEAADIDGATRFEKLVYITVPLIMPMFSLILITGYINAMGIFEPILIIFGDRNIIDSLNVVLYRIYNEAFKDFQYGFACALSVIFTIITFILTVVNMRFTDNSMFSFETGGKHGKGK